MSYTFKDSKGRFLGSLEELFVSSSPTPRTSSYPHFVFVARNDEPDRDLLSRPTNYLIIKFFHPSTLTSGGTGGRVQVVWTFYNDFSILRWLREKAIRNPV